MEERAGGDHGDVPPASAALNEAQGSEAAGVVSSVPAQPGFASVRGVIAGLRAGRAERLLTNMVSLNYK